MILFHLPVLFCYLPLHCLVTRTSTPFLSDAFQRFNAFYSLLPSILPSLQFTFQVSTHTVTLHSCACGGLLEHDSSCRDRREQQLSFEQRNIDSGRVAACGGPNKFYTKAGFTPGHDSSIKLAPAIVSEADCCSNHRCTRSFFLPTRDKSSF